MAILINDNYSLQACKPFDARYLNICSPWTSVSAVNAAIPTYRYTGLTVNIMGTEYWYKDGILDTCLIPKSLGGSGTLTGATNGLSLTNGGKRVKLGGILTGATDISGAVDMSFGNITPLNTYSVTANYDLLHRLTGDIASVYLNDGLGGTASLYGKTCTYVTSNDVRIANTGLTTYMRITGGTVELTGTIKLPITPSSGSTSDALLVWNSTDKKIKRLTGASVLSLAITGATNGLHTSGQKVVLGGLLTSGTTINVNGQTLAFSGTTGKVLSLVGTNFTTSYAYSCVSADYITLETGNGVNFAYVDINRTGNTITTCAKGGNLLFGTSKISGVGGCMIITAISGASYAGDYSGNFTNETLVTKRYVDRSSNISAVRFTDSDPFYVTTGDSYIGVSGVTTYGVWLPPTPICGQKISVADVCGNALMSPITICGNGFPINDGGTSLINTNYGSITFIFNSKFWSAVGFIN
jgi:hypothetical protein